MMRGTRERFHYRRCVECGCVQIVDPPADLAAYYGDRYYSFAAARRGWWSGIAVRLRSARDHAYLPAAPAWTRAMARVRPNPLVRCVSRCPGPRAGVLDVGAGDGRLLADLARLGFTQLLGVDPFASADRGDPRGFSVLRRDVHGLEVAGWNVVVLSHSLEHMADPVSTLRRVAQLLAPTGTCIVRIPLAGSWAHRTYGADWVQHDAPRHLMVHTRRGLELAAAAAGMRIVEVEFDSSGFQFWGSELYRRGVPLVRVSRSRLYWHFPPWVLLRYTRAARALNRKGDGDQATFYLRRAAPEAIAPSHLAPGGQG